MRLLLLLLALLGARGADAQATCACSLCVSSTCQDFTSVCNELPGGGTATCSYTNMKCAIPVCNAATSLSDTSVCQQVCALFGCPSSKWTCTSTGGGGGGDDKSGQDDARQQDDDATTIVIGLEEEKDDNTCFHEKTKITYKGRVLDLSQLLAGDEPECSVPHTPSARGVVITTDCEKTLRVTQTHLVATSTGFQLAHTLRPGDTLFGDMAGHELCTVARVAREATTERYFGLNCVHSELLADGLRTSTFGDFHTLPSWYMYYAGLALGPDAASRLGDAVADAFYSLYYTPA